MIKKQRRASRAEAVAPEVEEGPQESVAPSDGEAEEGYVNGSVPSSLPSQNAAISTNKPLEIRLSNALQKKLLSQAEEEGISLEEYISELLAESAVLRAWEIAEKKSHLRGGNTQQGQQPGQGNQQRRGNSGNNRQGKGGGNNRRGMSHSRYQAIMDDKATFLEYVRNQEKKRR